MVFGWVGRACVAVHAVSWGGAYGPSVWKVFVPLILRISVTSGEARVTSFQASSFFRQTSAMAWTEHIFAHASVAKSCGQACSSSGVAICMRRHWNSAKLRRGSGGSVRRVAELSRVHECVALPSKCAQASHHAIACASLFFSDSLALMMHSTS